MKPVPRHEPQHQKERADGLAGKGEKQNDLNQAFDVNHASGGVLRGKQHSAKTQLAPQQHGKPGRERHKAKSADLNQKQNDHLAEKVPVAPRVEQHQARDADRRGRREQRVQNRSRRARPRRDRQRQKNRARQNYQKKAYHNQPHRRRALQLLFQGRNLFSHSIHLNAMRNLKQLFHRPAGIDPRGKRQSQPITHDQLVKPDG